MNPPAPSFVDFFAGSGLVTQGAKHACVPVWSNDICPKKAAIYRANHGDDHFHLCSIEQVLGCSVSYAPARKEARCRGKFLQKTHLQN
jgi:DNA (cytosine-5)-methyltransferase 1